LLTEKEGRKSSTGGRSGRETTRPKNPEKGSHSRASSQTALNHILWTFQEPNGSEQENGWRHESREPKGGGEEGELGVKIYWTKQRKRAVPACREKNVLQADAIKLLRTGRKPNVRKQSRQNQITKGEKGKNLDGAARRVTPPLETEVCMWESSHA